MDRKLMIRKSMGLTIALALPVTLIVLVLQLLIVAALPTASGDLDAGFGTGGWVSLPITGSSQIGRAMALQSDGKVIIAGYDNWGTSNENIIMARYRTNGVLDTTFGAGGVVTMSLSAANDTAYAVDVQSDGKIVVAGLATAGGTGVPAIVRFNPDGSPDTTFGAGGVVTTTGLQPASAFLLSVAVLDDGRIVAGGGVVPPSSSGAPDTFLLMRYQSDGSPDTTLSGSGLVTTAIPGGDAISWGMAVQPDGKILQSGYVRGDLGGTDFALVRYNADGSLDSAFGAGGIVTQTISGSDYGYSVLLQQDGKIIVGGKADGGGIARYNSDGSYDNTFGSNPATNVVTYSVAGYASTSFSVMALENNDYIVAVGSVYTPGQPAPILVTVFDRDGILDADFGTGGLVTTTNASHYVSARAVAVQTDNKIVVGGNVDVDDTSGYDNDLILWRYNYVPITRIYLPLVIK